jgi:hypothetical protein
MLAGVVMCCGCGEVLNNKLTVYGDAEAIGATVFVGTERVGVLKEEIYHGPPDVREVSTGRPLPTGVIGDTVRVDGERAAGGLFDLRSSGPDIAIVGVLGDTLRCRFGPKADPSALTVTVSFKRRTIECP